MSSVSKTSTPGNLARELPSGASGATAAHPQIAWFTSEELLRGGRALDIAHDGCIYRLRITTTGKLILTK